ncbi:MAG: ATPase [Chloroflexi bacterium]|nr:ATPase [Chloroflexota bacterium]
MYDSFEVRNYRCLDHLELGSLKRFNLLTGVNNVGKTALLEALFLHMGAQNPSLTIRVQGFRGFDSMKLEFTRWAETPWLSLFADFDIAKTVELIGRDQANAERVVRLRVLREPQELERVADMLQPSAMVIRESPSSYEMPHVLELQYQEKERVETYVIALGPEGPLVRPIPPPPPFPGVFLAARARVPLTEDAARFGKLQLVGQDSLLLHALRILEPRLTRLALVLTGLVPTIHGDIGLGRLVPVPDMGEGMARLCSLLLAIGYASGGVILVDEIENGLHYSILSKVWQALGEAAQRFDVQVFATTHSWEAIVAAHQAFSRSESYDFRLHRLERVRGRMRAVTYDQNTLEAAIQAPLEVR